MNSPLRIGIIGFDTSHVPAFTQLLNDTSDPFHVSGARVVAGFPSYSPDIESSVAHVASFQKQLVEDFGVHITNSIEELVEQVDAILLHSLDGRRHLAEVRAVIAAHKPVFVDKPFAASYHDAKTIAQLATEAGCLIFSSSSLRFDANITALKNDPALGKILACDAFSPAALEPTNPGLLWYGIHGVEILYTFMGIGCQQVSVQSSKEYDVVTGIWEDGRIATMRGQRTGSLDFGATVFGENKVGQTLYNREIPIYSQLLKQIIPFFQGAGVPVPIDETLEMIAFMQAALKAQQEARVVKLIEVR